MITRLAWKNVWRKPARSLVVVTSVVIGIWSGLLVFAFMNGMTQQRLESQLKNYVSHTKIQHPKYEEEILSQYFLNKEDEITDTFSVTHAASKKASFWNSSPYHFVENPAQTVTSLEELKL